MIGQTLTRIRTWLSERAPDKHDLWVTAVLTILTAAGAGVLWAHFLPREVNLAISGLLFVAFILWPLRFGYLGSIVSAAFLLSGAPFTIRAWLMYAIIMNGWTAPDIRAGWPVTPFPSVPGSSPWRMLLMPCAQIDHTGVQ